MFLQLPRSIWEDDGGALSKEEQGHNAADEQDYPGNRPRLGFRIAEIDSRAPVPQKIVVEALVIGAHVDEATNDPEDHTNRSRSRRQPLPQTHSVRSLVCFACILANAYRCISVVDDNLILCSRICGCALFSRLCQIDVSMDGILPRLARTGIV